MSTAHLNPRCAPPLMMVRLTGPTGMESSRPLKKPVRAESKMDCSSGMWFSMRCVRVVLVFIFNFPAPGARDARPHKSVNQIRREKQRQNKHQDFFTQNDHTADKQNPHTA